VERALKVIIIPNTSPSPDSHHNGDKSQNLGETFEITQIGQEMLNLEPVDFVEA
jgi:hypothetical protein